jgi:hypothetical protein
MAYVAAPNLLRQMWVNNFIRTFSPGSYTSRVNGAKIFLGKIDFDVILGTCFYVSPAVIRNMSRILTKCSLQPRDTPYNVTL